MGVAELAEATVAGLEAAFVGPGGSGEDAATGGAPENRRAWLLAQTAALAEGLLRRRRLRNRPRVDDARARAAARRGGYPPRDAAALAAESTETAALYPRLRYLIEDIAGLTDCVALENAGVTDASRFAPGALRLPHSRAVFSRALRACLELDPEFFQPPLAGALVALLQDSSGVVRRAAGRDIARVLTVFEPDAQPRVMRERILPRLALAAALADEDAPGPSASADDDADGAEVGGGGGLRSAADVALAAEAARRARVEDEEMEDADAPGNGATAAGTRTAGTSIRCFDRLSEAARRRRRPRRRASRRRRCARSGTSRRRRPRWSRGACFCSSRTPRVNPPSARKTRAARRGRASSPRQRTS